MIVRLEGRILDKQPTRLVVGLGGMGLEVHVPFPVSQAAGGVGASVVLHTVLLVRADALTLYGFSRPEEQALFLKLIGVSGVGPRTALNALSGLTVLALVTAIREENPTDLMRIQGVGRKTAERIVMELKDSLAGFEAAAGAGGRGSAERDAVDALISLGYNRAAAQDAVRKAGEGRDGVKVEELVRGALSALTGGKRVGG